MKKQIIAFLLILITLILLVNPVVLAETRTLEIINLQGHSTSLTYQQLLAMPKTIVYAELYCYGNLVTSGNWGGITLSYLLNQVQPISEIASIQFMASDGYRVTIPIDLAIQEQIILAYDKDGQPLNEGYRLVLPEFNGANWIAQITTMSLSKSGANYPEVVSAGTGSLSKQLPEKIYPSQSPSPLPIQQPIPTIQSTPQNTPAASNISSINETISVQPSPKTDLTLDTSSGQNMQITAISAASTSLSVLIIYLIYLRKRKAG